MHHRVGRSMKTTEDTCLLYFTMLCYDQSTPQHHPWIMMMIVDTSRWYIHEEDNWRHALTLLRYVMLWSFHTTTPSMMMVATLGAKMLPHPEKKSHCTYTLFTPKTFIKTYKLVTYVAFYLKIDIFLVVWWTYID